MLSPDVERIRFYIVMPVYNVEKYVEQSIASVLAQTYSNYRLIMVDDGSPDRSGEICDRIAEGDARLRVVHQENGGQIAARETGVAEIAKMLGNENSENSYVLFLDSDDWLEADALERISLKISECDCDCLVYGYRIVRDGDGKSLYETPAESECTSREEACKRICSDTCYNSLCRKAIRLDIMRRVDCSAFSHIRLGEDCLQTLAALRMAKSISFLSDHLYNYRQNPQSMTNDINYEKFDFSYTVPIEVLRFLSDEGFCSETEIVAQRKRFTRRVYTDVIKLIFSGYEAKKKKRWLENIRGSEFFQVEILPHISYEAFSKKEALLMRAFVNRRYGFLLVYSRLSKMLNS